MKLLAIERTPLAQRTVAEQKHRDKAARDLYLSRGHPLGTPSRSLFLGSAIAQRDTADRIATGLMSHMLDKKVQQLVELPYGKPAFLQQEPDPASAEAETHTEGRFHEPERVNPHE